MSSSATPPGGEFYGRGMTTTPNKDGGPHAAAIRLLAAEVAELTRAAEYAQEASLRADQRGRPAHGRLLDQRATTFATQAAELQESVNILADVRAALLAREAAELEGTVDILAGRRSVVIQPSGQEYTRFPTPEEVEAARVEVEATVRKAVARLVQAMTDDGK